MKTLTVDIVPISDLKPHPRNYRFHGPEQLKHIVESLKSHGVYRNIVVAEDNTILAGHGVVMGCKELGLEKISIVRLPLKPTSAKALKILAGDNEISRLGLVDDRLLTETLKEIDLEDDLLGTGFDKLQLANLLFVTRPSSEIQDFDSAKEWVGLPDYDETDEAATFLPVIEIIFQTEEDRKKFVAETELKISSTRGGRKWQTTWPYQDKHDFKSVRFEE